MDVDFYILNYSILELQPIINLRLDIQINFYIFEKLQ